MAALSICKCYIRRTHKCQASERANCAERNRVRFLPEPHPALPRFGFNSINGLTICVEVLSAGCCTLDTPHRPMGPAAARVRSLEFRGWTPLVVPFHEWSALAADDSPPALARQAGPDGEVKRLRALQEAAAARQRYLRIKLEELLGEELPPLPQKAAKRRMC